jgi:hypothetical protein
MQVDRLLDLLFKPLSVSFSALFLFFIIILRSTAAYSTTSGPELSSILADILKYIIINYDVIEHLNYNVMFILKISIFVFFFIIFFFF